jgi:hypothetical protein
LTAVVLDTVTNSGTGHVQTGEDRSGSSILWALDLPNNSKCCLAVVLPSGAEEVVDDQILSRVLCDIEAHLMFARKLPLHDGAAFAAVVTLM